MKHLWKEDVITKKSGSALHQEVDVEVLLQWNFTGMQCSNQQPLKNIRSPDDCEWDPGKFYLPLLQTTMHITQQVVKDNTIYLITVILIMNSLLTIQTVIRHLFCNPLNANLMKD